MASGFSVSLAPEWDELSYFYVRVPMPYVRRRNLTPEELGVLTWLLSHRPGFKMNERYIQGAFSVGRDKVRRILRNLETQGILKRDQLRDEGTGRLGDAEWQLVPPAEFLALARQNSDYAHKNEAEPQVNPSTENPSTGATSGNTENPQVKPSTENPSTDNAHQREITKKGDHTHKGRAPVAPDPGGVESGASAAVVEPADTEGSGGPSASVSDIHDGHRLTAERILRRAVGIGPAQRISDGKRRHLIDMTAQLVADGHTAATIAARLDGAVTATTYAPYSVVRQRLDELAEETPRGQTAEQPPLADWEIVRDPIPPYRRRCAGRICGNTPDYRAICDASCPPECNQVHGARGAPLTCPECADPNIIHAQKCS